jgi:DNA invertase Pin-like site-specific DNA recombinase
MGMRAALFVRVSTDEQTVENQERELQEIAARRGWKVVEVYREEGVSSGKSREKRPQLDAMLNAAARRRLDIVLTWALDRLGRSPVDLLNTIQALERSSVDLYIASMSLKGGEPRVVDTTDPRDKLLFQITAAFSEFERSLINQRIRSGIDRVKVKARQGRQVRDERRQDTHPARATWHGPGGGQGGRGQAESRCQHQAGRQGHQAVGRRCAQDRQGDARRRLRTQKGRRAGLAERGACTAVNGANA